MILYIIKYIEKTINGWIVNFNYYYFLIGTLKLSLNEIFWFKNYYKID